MKKSKYQKDITRINERLSSLHRTFGNDDSTYNSMVSYLTSITDNYHTTTKGYIAISQSEKGDKLSDKEINKLLNYMTTRQKIKKAKEELKNRGIEKPDRESAILQTQINSKIKDFIREHEMEIYADKGLYNAVKRRGNENKARLYYDEAIKIMNIENEKKSIEEYHDPFNNERIIE